ncbi:hypothetical protein SA19059_09530 [Staphylococcus argenteus]|nr:hypothetical protein SA19059_09530 [Staphylococcus argenteus]
MLSEPEPLSDPESLVESESESSGIGSISPGSSGCSGTTGLSIPSPEPEPLLNATSLSQDIERHTIFEL